MYQSPEGREGVRTITPESQSSERQGRNFCNTSSLD